MKKTFHLSAGVDGALKDVNREIELHLELRTKEFEALGMNAEDARRAALEAFGDRNAIEHEVSALRETTVRERQRRDWFAELKQDALIGLRSLRRARAFTIVALLTLGVGIGANTAIFSVVRSILLRPLPYANAEQLVQLWTDHRALGRAEPEWLNPPDFFDWRDNNKTFVAMAAYQGWGPDMTGNGDPESLSGLSVSGNMFAMLNARPAIGRLLATADDDAGAEPVAIISNAFWKRRFGSDSTILGKQLTLSGTPWTVVGVLPASFRAPLPTAPDIFRAIRRPANAPCDRNCFTYKVIGRMKAGVSIDAARADISRLAAQEARDYPQSNAKVGAWLVPLHEQLVGQSKSALFALSVAVLLVLLIGCVNLANLLLVRGAARTRELGVRAALGAGRGRMIRQLLTENLMLALMGGAIGIALGVVGSRVMATMVPQSIRQVQEIRIDAPVLIFAGAITLFAALLFGLLPAIQAVRSNLMGALRSGTRETGRRGGALRSSLVVAQLSLAVVLLVGAGLFLRSFLMLQQVDLGFRSSGVALAPVFFPRGRYPDAPRAILALEELTGKLRANPAFKSVEITDLPPLNPGDQDVTAIPVGEPPRTDLPPSMWIRSVSPGYLSQMHMRLIAGRNITAADKDSGALVAVINQESARRYFPGTNAVGRQLATGPEANARKLTVIGIVASGRQDGPNQPFKNEMFLPIAQFPARGVTLIIEPSHSLAAANDAFRSTLHEVDALIPAPTLEPIEVRLGTAVALPRLYTMLVAIFATAALLLAVLGVYGVMAYSVAQRQREIGVRLALGAAPSTILAMVVRQGGKLALIGVVVGVGSALLLGQFVKSLLFGVTAFDAPTLIVVPLVLGAMTIVASWLPARRAMKVDPLTAIRAD
ncbi:MAG: ABC transporter permease [Gemmatimonadaceae bacterium]